MFSSGWNRHGSSRRGHGHHHGHRRGDSRPRWAPSHLSAPGPWGQGGSFSYNGMGNMGRPMSQGPMGSTFGYKPQGYASNLENNLPLAQGSQRPFAQGSTISSLVTNLLYQSRQSPQNYWGNFFGTTGGYGGASYGYMGAGAYNPYTGYSQPYNSRGGYGQGGGYGGAYGGPGYGMMSDSTSQALALADSYFAPKRLNLAYQLGDMETDMRRLAVNLGRQVDDPILQAKLYKEAMMNVRTLDSEQNQFAVNMVEQRRKEDLQNQQFYAQLDMESQKMDMQNQQFYDQLDQQQSQFRASQG